MRVEITDDEFRVLYHILRNVGGSPKRSDRKHAQSLLGKMYKIIERNNLVMGTVKIDPKWRNIFFLDLVPKDEIPEKKKVESDLNLIF